MNRTPPQPDTLWTSKPIQCVLLFGVFCALATATQSPWWSGALLNVEPVWPANWAAFGLHNAPAAPGAPEAPLTPASAEPIEPELPEVDLVALEAQLKAKQAQAMQARAEVKDRSTQRAQAKALMAKLAKPLKAAGQPVVMLERPCLASAKDGTCTARAMDAFYDELIALMSGARTTPVRMAQFGDSLIAGDGFTGELRRLMQAQFGDAGHGFVALRAPSRYIGHEGLRVSDSEAWALDTMNKGGSARALGLAGMSFRRDGAPSLSLRATSSARQFDRIGVLHDGQPGALEIAGGEGRQLLRFERGEGPRVTWLKLPAASDEIKLERFQGQGAYYGALLERDVPGVIVDNLGMLSAREASLARIDRAHWDAAMRQRGVNLASFAFGTNSAGKSAPGERWLSRYQSGYTSVLGGAMSVEHQRDCLVLSILTRGAREEGEIREYPSVQPLIKAQREAAKAAGCAFWDMNAALGGAQGAARWYERQPRWLGADLTHPTRGGYQQMARMFYAALLHDLNAHLEERAR